MSLRITPTVERSAGDFMTSRDDFPDELEDGDEISGTSLSTPSQAVTDQNPRDANDSTG